MFIHKIRCGIREVKASSDNDFQRLRKEEKQLNLELDKKRNTLMDAFNTARYQRIATGLKLSAEINTADVLLLQEVTEEQRTVLQTTLGDEWEVLPRSDHNLVSCYKKNKFEHSDLLQTSETQHSITEDEAADFIQIFKLTDKNTSKSIQIVNFHGKFTDKGDPTNCKKDGILNKLLSKNPTGATIVAGDFNIQMQAIEGQKGITGMVPPEFNYCNIQDEVKPTDKNVEHEIGASTDGGLYKSVNKPGTRASMQAIDIISGKIIPDSTFNTTQSLTYTPIDHSIYSSEEEQQIIKLLQICKDYQLHLNKQDAYKDEKITNEKRDIVNSLVTALEESKLDEFRSIFNDNKAVIGKNRDSHGVYFIKCVMTVLSAGIAVAFRLWKVKGRDINKKIDETIECSAEDKKSPNI